MYVEVTQLHTTTNKQAQLKPGTLAAAAEYGDESRTDESAPTVASAWYTPVELHAGQLECGGGPSVECPAAHQAQQAGSHEREGGKGSGDTPGGKVTHHTLLNLC